MSSLARTAAFPALAAALALAAGCAPQASGSRPPSSVSSPSTGPGTPVPGQTASQTHWQTALAALGQGAAPRAPLLVEAAAIARWNELLAQSWPEVRAKLIDPRLELELRKALASVGAGGSILSIQGIRNLVIDTAAPPAIVGGGAGAALNAGVDAPGAGRWRVACTADVVATITINLGGFSISPSVAVDVTVDASDIRLSGRAAIDATRPERPMLAGSSGAPQVDLRLTLASQDPWASQVLGPLTQALDPVLRVALALGGIYVQQQAGALISGVLPALPWGSPAPGAAPLPAGTTPLAQAAEATSDEIQRIHAPHGLVLPARFDQPGPGNGRLAGYYDYGDSVAWSGSYLAAEAMRWELTGDARALAAASRAADAIHDCLEVAGGDLLSRCVVPMSSPYIADISGKTDFFVGSVRGVPTGSVGDVSRDSYEGGTLGMVQAWLRVPALRPLAGDFISRNMGYLVAHDWNATMVGSPALSRASPFSQTPGIVLMLAKAANLVDRPRWGALHDRLQDLGSILWLNAWFSSREVHESYYKFQISGDEILTRGVLETDPARYRDYVKEAVIVEDAIGFHQNAYWDMVFGATVPAAAAAKSAAIEDALLRWTVRPSRAFPMDLRQDATIAKASYAPASYNAQGLVTNGPATLYSLHPLPVERRSSRDFLWIADPFELDNWDDPFKEYPGIDLILPYWGARSYGIIR